MIQSSPNPRRWSSTAAGMCSALVLIGIGGGSFLALPTGTEGAAVGYDLRFKQTVADDLGTVSDIAVAEDGRTLIYTARSMMWIANRLSPSIWCHSEGPDAAGISHYGRGYDAWPEWIYSQDRHSCAAWTSDNVSPETGYANAQTRRLMDGRSSNGGDLCRADRTDVKGLIYWTRDPTTGRLLQNYSLSTPRMRTGASTVTISGDGKSVFAVLNAESKCGCTTRCSNAGRAERGGVLSVWTRDPATGVINDSSRVDIWRGLYRSNPTHVTVSPDGRDVYLTLLYNLRSSLDRSGECCTPQHANGINNPDGTVRPPGEGSSSTLRTSDSSLVHWRRDPDTGILSAPGYACCPACPRVQNGGCGVEVHPDGNPDGRPAATVDWSNAMSPDVSVPRANPEASAQRFGPRCSPSSLRCVTA